MLGDHNTIKAQNAVILDNVFISIEFQHTLKDLVLPVAHECIHSATHWITGVRFLAAFILLRVELAQLLQYVGCFLFEAANEPCRLGQSRVVTSPTVNEAGKTRFASSLSMSLSAIRSAMCCSLSSM